ncbi:aldehyde dehydrogenase [Legionella geestiana]|uniref:aldehyde dehydrogenase (NAD(+)) n=1 Tax=Legionella geestiana TaxID=45065 RepID=A0A0W0U919_9GAMM|nr:aldehyde dehydrogenase family protein [Legionella geestiana]KTD04182.1 aldehyde dehydrogenase [Legionella geestiana]QBS11607.1 aldehyde dehydrogenase family protein [Legionella geestiana]QDQ40782.1 aldehyde dehydrogenase family protein [Legionella geestiana]STX53714.1 aldehyde dehydrogenase [Legionella geestiana]
MTLLKSLGIEPLNPGAFSGSTVAGNLEGRRLVSFNPSTGERLAEVATCTMEDYHVLMERLQKAFLAWREVPAPQRGNIIRQMGDALRRHKDALGSLVALEMGKSKQEGDGEVQEMIDIADFAVGQSRMLYGKTMHSERPMHRMYEQWHPYGVVGVISAFNFPVAVWAWNAFIAAICGNVTLWKPSAKTPLCAIAVQHICNAVLTENNCPEIFALCIPESHAIADAMVEDTRIPLVSFTGSTAVGRTVAAKVATRLGRSILELGGNNAIILDESADLNLAIPAIVFGAVGTAGQRCTSTRRLFVPRACHDDIVERLRKAYAQVTIGNPLDTKNLMGPLIDAGAVNQFRDAIARIAKAGGRIVYGGEALTGDGHFVQPTLVCGVENQWDIVQEETFAPILYVMPYDTLEEAIALQNAVPQGLSSALFTTTLSHAERFLSAMGSDCGIANINIGTSGAEIGGAFGGEKETGGGRESGSDAWKGYMRRQTNTINWGKTLPLAQGIRFEL